VRSRALWLGIGVVVAVLSLRSASWLQAPAANQDESKVPAYTLPDPLRFDNGERVSDVKTWRTRRRPELIHLFETQVYGRSAHAPIGLKSVRAVVDSHALDGKAIRKEIAVLFTGAADGPRMNLLAYVPTGSRVAGRKVPAFLGLNFTGNHTVHADRGITLPMIWRRPGSDQPYIQERASEASRGAASTRWPVDDILSRGYALVTAYYFDIEPDFPEGWKHGVRAHLSPPPITNLTLPPKATPAEIETLRAKIPQHHGLDRWGALGAWSWALSRALDSLQADEHIDATRVVVTGHSRLGKAALWAGALDERFAMVVANESGEGGAAITRRKFGETITRITTAFPHWFCGMFSYYQDREADLPVDFHELVALVAPRPVYIASAAEDLWADPRGEFLSAKGAEPVYQLFGKKGLGVDQMPAIDTPVGETIGYHVRRGKHDITAYDWEQYLAFADRHLR
jgi:(4-O-methyl)-D-glucuronate---lignin esterase